MHPIIPIAIFAGIIALIANESGKKESAPKQLPEEDIVEVVAELLSDNETDVAHSPKQKEIVELSQIAAAINKTGATDMNDLDKVMAELNTTSSDISSQVRTVFWAKDFWAWEEKQPPEQSNKLALPHNATDASASPTIALLDIDDVYASIRQWDKDRNQSSFANVFTPKCDCKKGDKQTPKALFASKEKAQMIAARYQKRGQRQRVYECPQKKGWHLTSKPPQN